MKLEPWQEQRLSAYFNITPPKCSRCKPGQLIDPEIIYLPTMPEDDETRLPVIKCHCNQCGFIHQFDYETVIGKF